MRMNDKTPLGLAYLIAAVVILFGAAVNSANAEPGLIEALTAGRPDLFLRYRFEYVEDGTPRLKEAFASTLRTALGYNTGTFYDFGLYVQFEDVRVIGNDLFDDGGSNNRLDRAQVVDPEGTEVHQANLRYEGIPKTVLRLGRQEIEHRQAPLHRYIGNILWRQNWQSFDGFRVLNLSLPNTIADYGYIWNVNRIFGEDNPLPDRSDFRIDGHLLRAEYTGFALGKFEPYAYLLDFESVPSEKFSTATYGLRLQGDYGVLPKTKLLYTVEFAHQTDYRENPNDIDVNYYLSELGGSYAVGGPIEAVTLKVSYEVLEGDGEVLTILPPQRYNAVQTPLGTNHAFQGWADRFLVTPNDGIEDFFVTLSVKVFGAQFMAVYHDFNSNNDDYDYGTEWDLVLENPLRKISWWASNTPTTRPTPTSCEIAVRARPLI
jgi:hypothetical protein